MKWVVQFRERKHSCCPPSFYWAVKDTIVVAETKQQVLEKLKKGRIAVEIQKITSYE